MGLKFCYPSEFKDRKERYKLIEFESPQEKERFSCVKCKDILIEPHQLDCGCRFCLSCLKECWNICPECNIDGKSTYAKKGVITYDKAAEREILELQTNCINKRCPHKCKLKDLQNHLDTCEYSDNRDDSDECEIILIKCDDCGEELSIEELNGEHKNINGDTSLLCSNWRTVCPYECNGEIQENVKNHLKSCPCVCVDCPMKEAGCTKVLPRSEMDEHIRNEASNHMVLMMQEMNKLMRENNALKSEHQESSDKLKREIEELRNSVAYSEREISKLTETVSLCEKNYNVLLNEANVLKQTLNSSRIIKSGLQNCASSMSAITKDGFFVWKIDKIVDKIKEAKMGINTQIWSEPFYTHSPGYRLCLKLYPAGDGKRAENHVSLYFVIMKGDYDDEVSWPFKKKICLSLQSNDKAFKDRSINMKPDSNISCYGRPTNAHNLAAGQPKFISHVELISTDEFIENDSITIHAKVF